MAGDQRSGDDRQNTAGLNADGKLRLTLREDRRTSSRLSVSLPQPPMDIVSTERSASVADEMQKLARDPVVLANRARLARLYELRSPAPVDAHDAFLGCFWLLLVFAISGAVGEMFLELEIIWAAILAFAVDVGGTAVLLSELDRRERKMMRECQKGIVDAPPPPTFHWRLLTPHSVLTRLRAQFNELNVDDSELEDSLEPLYRHGSDPYDFGNITSQNESQRRPDR